MEILETTSVTAVAWWTILAMFGMLGFGIAAICCFSDEYILSGTICLLAGIACILIIILLPITIPTGQIKYTVEITDPAQYKSLIDQGYEITHLYDHKEIYTIVGDILK